MVGVTGGSFIWGVGGGPAGGGAATPHGTAPMLSNSGVIKQTLTSRTREARAGKTKNGSRGPRGPGAVLEKVLGITTEKNVSTTLNGW